VNPGKQLHDLQEIDLDLERKAEALSQVQSRLSRNESLEKAKEQLEAKRKQLAEVEKRQKDSERATDDLLAKAKPLKEKLYSGSVGNPKELAGLEHQVAQLTKETKVEEDITLELMGQAEATQKGIAEQAGRLGKMEEEWQKMREELLAEQESLLSAIDAATKKREEVVATIEPSHFELYRLVSARKQGYAVARIEQARCQGCRITLSMNDMTRARSGDLVQCDSCGRILYLG